MIENLKNIIRPYYVAVGNYQKKREFERLVAKAKQQGLPLKIVIGSAGIFDPGWIPSEEYILDLLDETTWKRYFNENELDALLAEHVWEHLTAEQGLIAAKVCFKFLKKGGYMRIAVPDGFHQSEKYIDYVKPGGHGAGADDHKLLYNYKTFSAVFSNAGFQVKVLECFDENHTFQFNDWSIQEGKISRSIRFDERNKDGNPHYTSIIIDAIK